MSDERLVERMRGFGTTIFAEMSARAVATGSVNLGQGFPDTDGPAELLDAAVEAIRGGHNQYPPGPGVPALRHAIAEHQRRNYGLDHDPDAEVLVTAGATEAIAAAVTALAGPGDEVVLFEPYYDSYAACVALGGATRRTVTVERDGAGWGFDPAALASAVTPRTKAIVLNTPHNPTGTVFGPAELAEIARVAVEHDLVVVSDEVYEHLTFDGRAHVPIATLPGMRKRTITVSSAGKTFGVTGWKIGWVCAPPDLVAAVRTVKQFLTFVNGAPFQPAVAQVLDRAETLAPAAALQAQRDLLCDGLDRLGLDVARPQATYFATVDVGTDAVAWCRELPDRAGVVAIPSSVFYDTDAGDHYVRLAFCKQPHVLDDALARLEKVLG
ncbi:N-succinyldiaminopimelate aminotransferase [Jatrophihabitans endophyticus]|uniref:N-succinyldiaminopimelate aminotransferase n=1 Tax=Jatrophihabitans endophyticus TaxID=1206085 RepID=A0A1M5T9I4_9ACTN|nr:pyridoxal phosphate-dependent aminotransferase [Jatrophihabitans endophyticus]SHH47033.1 N-succinyldiaminopimelate aminotransferase [Jatrophihabitans endophyticus]